MEDYSTAAHTAWRVHDFEWLFRDKKSPTEYCSYIGYVAFCFVESCDMSLITNNSHNCCKEHLEQAGVVRPLLILCCVLVWLREWVQFDCATTVM